MAMNREPFQGIIYLSNVTWRLCTAPLGVTLVCGHIYQITFATTPIGQAIAVHLVRENRPISTLPDNPLIHWNATWLFQLIR